MKTFILIFSLFSSIPAFAITDYSVSFSFKEEKIQITCHKRCDWDLNDEHGSASADYFSNEMKSLIDLVNANELPEKMVTNREEFYVTVRLKANNRSTSFTLGQPKNYDGVDSERFSKLNDHIQKIEALVKAKKPHKKIKFDKMNSQS